HVTGVVPAPDVLRFRVAQTDDGQSSHLSAFLSGIPNVPQDEGGRPHLSASLAYPSRLFSSWSTYSRCIAAPTICRTVSSLSPQSTFPVVFSKFPSSNTVGQIDADRHSRSCSRRARTCRLAASTLDSNRRRMGRVPARNTSGLSVRRASDGSSCMAF